MHDVIGPQQDIALASGKGRGHGAFGNVCQVTQGGRHHHLVAFHAQYGGREYAVADELRHQARGRTVVKRVGVVPLVKATLVHHPNHVADGKGLELVVRDEESRGLCFLQNLAHLVCQAFTQIHVQVGERLIQQQQLGLRCEGARQGHPLLLAPGEFMGKTACTAGEPHQAQDSLHPLLTSLAFPVGQAEPDVVTDIQVGEQGVVLKHHADAALLGGHMQAWLAHHLAIEPDTPTGHGLQTCHAAQQGGLATAGRSDEHAHFSGPQSQGDLVDRGLDAPGILDLQLRDIKKHAEHCR